MNDPVRPASLFGAAAATSLPSGSVGTIHNPPPEVAQLANGTTLRGIVQGPDGRGRLLVRTELGLLQIATKTAPPPNTEVVLQLRSSGGQLHVLLMHAEAPAPRASGAAPPLVPPGLAGGAAPPPVSGGAAPAPVPSPHGTTDVFALGQNLRAVVQAPPVAPATVPSAATSAPAPFPLPHFEIGSRVALRVLSVTPPGSGPAPPPPAVPRLDDAVAARHRLASGSEAGATGPMAKGRAATGGATAPGPALAGAPRGHGPVPAGPTAPLLGRVLTTTHAQQPVLQTPVGTLTLEVAAPLPPGSRVAFELVAPTPARPTAAVPTVATGAAATLAHTWPALEEALESLLETVAPKVGAATGPLGDLVPQPGPRLASGLLFFLSALSAGDLGRWLGGQALQSLRSAGREALVQRLTQDFAQLGRMAEAAPGEWRLLAMPVLDGHQVQQVRLWLRQQRDEARRKSAAREREATRFVLEVEFSELGDLQLDGLVRGKRFDLMLRSRGSLPDHMRREIIRIFDEANAIGGYDGSVGFQASPDWRFLSLDRFDEGAPTLVV